MRCTLDEILGPFCTAAKRCGARIEIIRDHLGGWSAQFRLGQVRHLCPGITAQGAADALENKLSEGRSP